MNQRTSSPAVRLLVIPLAVGLCALAALLPMALVIVHALHTLCRLLGGAA